MDNYCRSEDICLSNSCCYISTGGLPGSYDGVFWVLQLLQATEPDARSAGWTGLQTGLVTGPQSIQWSVRDDGRCVCRLCMCVVG